MVIENTLRNGIERCSWYSSRSRQIDKNTLLGLLGIIVYESERAAVLDLAGFRDEGCTAALLLDYVLDAIGVPEEGHREELGGEDAPAFSRDAFYKFVFSAFSFEFNELENPPLEELLGSLVYEASNNIKRHYI